MQTLSKGSKGDDVRTAQTMLNLAGFPCAIDGDFGTETYNAVRSFQTIYGLKVDGIIGVNTWSALTAVTTQPLTVSPSTTTGTTPSGTIPIPTPPSMPTPSTIPTISQIGPGAQPASKNMIWLYVAIGAMIWYFQQQKKGTVPATA